MNTQTSLLQSIAWIACAFLCGSLPLSYWLGKLVLHKDIRNYGDGNPGATNVLRAGGWKIGVLAYVLEFGKSALPVALAYHVYGLRGIPMLLTALAPMFGHAYSPFLKGRGGKGLAVILGAWIGLTMGVAAAVILLMLIFWYAILTVEGWAVLLTGLGLVAYLLAAGASPLLLSIAVLQLLFAIWKHLPDLKKRPALRGWIRKRFFPS